MKDIAVVGMGCTYPGSKNPVEMWQNILSKRQQFRRMLDQRLPLSEYYSEDMNAPDKLYAQRAAYINDFDFDWLSKRIPKKTYEGTDIVQWLALYTAEQAIADAGYSRETIPSEKTGVILGNSLTGEQTRSNNLRLRWPYIQKTLINSAPSIGLKGQALELFLQETEAVFKSVFPEVDEDTLQGGLSNTVAGRVANFFNLHGGGYVVDGACSSSLIAVCTAVDHLVLGNMDVVLAGGVDISLDTFELIGFAKTSALTKNDMHVYDKRAKGFIPGEGCGFVVLKRLEDAKQQGDHIYAVIKGAGVSSDGKGGMTAPSANGQALALIRAYEKAGYSPGDLDFIEGHGTGTKRGDVTELAGIALAAEHFGKPQPRKTAMTSLKSIFGHTKAAAGIGAFIKAVIAVNRRVIPPTAGCSQPNDIFNEQATNLFPAIHGRLCDRNKTLTAGVSAMGFGGINSHVTLQSFEGQEPSARLQPDISERSLIASWQDSEVFLFAASSTQQLQRFIEAACFEFEHMAIAELSDFSASVARKYEKSTGQYRCALVGASPQQLLSKCRHMIAVLAGEEQYREDRAIEQGIFYSDDFKTLNVAFAFPGQGSQKINCARNLYRRYDWAKEIVEKADAIFKEVLGINVVELLFRDSDTLVSAAENRIANESIKDTLVAQPVICLSSVLHYHFIGTLGITPAIVCGHSLGELTALYAAGAIELTTLFELVAHRAKAMASVDSVGAMAVFPGTEDQANKFIGRIDGYITCANLNAPNQTIVSGDAHAVDLLIDAAGAKGIDIKKIPVSAAFHSNHMDHAVEQFKNSIAALNLSKVKLVTPLLSSVSGQLLTEFEDLSKYLVEQIRKPVNFIAVAEQLNRLASGVAEIGPGSVLTNLLDNNGVKLEFAASTYHLRDSYLGINRLVGYAWMRRESVTLIEAFEGRYHRPYIAQNQRKYLENPCERPQKPVVKSNSAPRMLSDDQPNSAFGDTSPLLNLPFSTDFLTDYLGNRGDFLAQIILADSNSRSYLSGGDEFAGAGTSRWRSSGQKLMVEDSKLEESKLETPSSLGVTSATHATNAMQAPASESEDAVLQSSDLGQSSIHFVKQEVADLTGFELSVLDDEMRLLDDLNIDSIKVGVLVSKIQQKAGIESIEASSMSNASIAELAQLVDANSPENERVSTAKIATTPSDIKTQIVSIIEGLTGFDRENISDEFKLLDDLNMDSIKAGQLLSKTQQVLAIDDSMDVSHMLNASIAEIVEAFTVESIGAGTDASGESLTEEAGGSQKKLTQSAVENALMAEIAEVSGFELASLTAELSLIDDLNLDSIKSAQILSKVLASLEVSEDIDMALLSELTIAEIAAIIIGELPNASKVTGKNSRVEDGSRTNGRVSVSADSIETFTYTCVNSDWVEPTIRARTIVLHGVFEKDEQSIWCEQLIKNGYEVLIYNDSIQSASAHNLQSSLLLSVAPLPSLGESETNDCEYLSELVSLVESLNIGGVCIVAEGNGVFGLEVDSEPSNNNENLIPAYSAFLRSYSLESPNRSIMSIDANTELGCRKTAELVAAEVRLEKGFSARGFCQKGNRWLPVVQAHNLASFGDAPSQFSREDCIVVSGGAKGITAQCVIALSKVTPCTYVLLGRSAFDENSSGGEIAETIKAIAANGAKAAYYQCDVSDQQQVQQVLTEIERQYGEPAALIHGAGINRARPVTTVSASMAAQEISPKVTGLRNLLAALNFNSVKKVVAFGSVIGVAGMQGNAWYAYSNERVVSILRRLSYQFPSIETQCLSYSVWGEVGMGHDMGVVDSLEASGVGSISTRLGSQSFVDAFCYQQPKRHFVMTNGMQGLVTWKGLEQPITDSKRLRFVQNVEHLDGRQGCISSVALNTQVDRYLLDHNFRGTLLFPTVFALEAMTQVASVLQGGLAKPTSIRSVSLAKPIIVPLEGKETIRIKACHVDASDFPGGDMESWVSAIRVDIFCAASGFKTAHFSAVLCYNELVEKSVEPLAITDKLPVLPREHLYGEHLFQGKLFQQLESIYSYSNNAVLFSINTRTQNLVSDGYDQNTFYTHLLGDAYYRDALLQVAQLPASPKIVLPLAIDRINLLPSEQGDTKTLYGRAQLRFQEAEDFIWDITVTNDSGDIVEQLLGYRVRTVKGPDSGGRSVEGLLESLQRGSFRRGLHSVVNNLPTEVSQYLPNICCKDIFQLGREKNTIRTDIARQLIASEAGLDGGENFFIEHSDSGRPLLSSRNQAVQSEISISHSNYLLLGVRGLGAQGCDVEEVLDYAAEVDWPRMVGSEGMQIMHALQGTAGMDEAESGTLIWSVKEAAAKYFESWDLSFSDLLIQDNYQLYELCCGTNSVVVCGFLLPSSSETLTVAVALNNISVLADFGMHIQRMRA